MAPRKRNQTSEPVEGSTSARQIRGKRTAATRAKHEDSAVTQNKFFNLLRSMQTNSPSTEGSLADSGALLENKSENERELIREMAQNAMYHSRSRYDSPAKGRGAGRKPRGSLALGRDSSSRALYNLNMGVPNSPEMSIIVSIEEVKIPRRRRTRSKTKRGTSKGRGKGKVTRRRSKVRRRRPIRRRRVIRRRTTTRRPRTTTRRPRTTTRRYKPSKRRRASVSVRSEHSDKAEVDAYSDC